MDSLYFTLIGEGSSDRSLVPILEWALREQGVLTPKGKFARWDILPQKPANVAQKIVSGFDLYPADLIFVHQDADQVGTNTRKKQIASAFQEAKDLRSINIPAVPVIPLRETEAWLLIEENAIRLAAGNPNGKDDLRLEPLKSIEKCSDPKKELERALRAARGWNPQRLKRFDTRAAMARVVEYIADFSPLRSLSAFRALEEDLAALKQNGWRAVA